MKIEIQIVDRVEKDDLLIYDGKKFVPFNKKKIDKPVIKLQEEIQELKKEIKILKLQFKLDHGEITKEKFDEEVSKL